jgi:hypothetical protein
VTIHLEINGDVWCPQMNPDETTYDPRDATCVECLRTAASYGAAAAMRYAAVESGATRDPELVRERDEAIRRMNAVCDALEAQEAFFCCDCMKLRHTRDRALAVNSSSWCVDCAPHKVT